MSDSAVLKQNNLRHLRIEMLKVSLNLIRLLYTAYVIIPTEILKSY